MEVETCNAVQGIKVSSLFYIQQRNEQTSTVLFNKLIPNSEMHMSGWKVYETVKPTSSTSFWCVQFYSYKQDLR